MIIVVLFKIHFHVTYYPDDHLVKGNMDNNHNSLSFIDHRADHIVHSRSDIPGIEPRLVNSSGRTHKTAYIETDKLYFIEENDHWHGVFIPPIRGSNDEHINIGLLRKVAWLDMRRNVEYTPCLRVHLILNFNLTMNINAFNRSRQNTSMYNIIMNLDDMSDLRLSHYNVRSLSHQQWHVEGISYKEFMLVFPIQVSFVSFTVIKNKRHPVYRLFNDYYKCLVNLYRGYNSTDKVNPLTMLTKCHSSLSISCNTLRNVAFSCSLSPLLNLSYFNNNFIHFSFNVKTRE